MVLTAETMVPTQVVGRIIGKSGQNVFFFLIIINSKKIQVQELQRITQALVRIPDEQVESSETPVRIIGNFFSLQSVQARFSTLIVESEGIR